VLQTGYQYKGLFLPSGMNHGVNWKNCVKIQSHYCSSWRPVLMLFKNLFFEAAREVQFARNCGQQSITSFSGNFSMQIVLCNLYFSLSKKRFADVLFSNYKLQVCILMMPCLAHKRDLPYSTAGFYPDSNFALNFPDSSASPSRFYMIML